METVGICKLPTEPLGQQDADGRLSRAGYTHHHHDHRNSPGKPTGQSMLKSFITDWGFRVGRLSGRVGRLLPALFDLGTLGFWMNTRPNAIDFNSRHQAKRNCQRRSDRSVRPHKILVNQLLMSVDGSFRAISFPGG